jgi:photosystem II stability/assembly factor-like uncharacterized protein
MSKTATRTKATLAKKRAAQQKRRRPPQKPWYQRVTVTTWIVIGVIAAVLAFALLSRGSEAPEGPSALPVVGGDLHSLVVDPRDPTRLFIGSHQGVSVSTDGGETWEVVESLNGADAMGWGFTDEAILVGGHPGLYVSPDGGESFDQRNEGLPNTDVHALGAGNGVIYGASPAAGFFASTDRGETWSVRNPEVGRAFMGEILVNPDNPQHVVAPDMQAGAVESTDGGETWEALGGVQGAMWVSWDPEDTDDILVTATGSAARSTDGGKTWDAMEVPAGASIVEFSPSEPETLYAAVHEDPEARIWVSADDGETWEQL